MKAFFFDSSTGEGVPSAAPEEISHPACLKILNRFRTEGSFLGVNLIDGRILQVRREKDGLFWVEILEPRSRLAEGCVANLPITEVALEAAATGRPIKKALSDYYLRWEEATI